MKKQLAAIILAAILCLSLCSCAKEEAAPQSLETVTVWCVEGFPAAEALSGLIDEFNSIPENAVAVELQAFADEDGMAAMLNSLRPDLMLCYSDRAWMIEELVDAVSIPALQKAELNAGFTAFSGGNFLPFGGEVSLLVSRKGADLQGLTLPKLYERAVGSGESFLAVSSYADLFAASMEEMDSDFHFDVSTDREDGSFAYLYNLFAELAFSGSLRLCESAAEAVSTGEVSCAVVRSDELMGVDLSHCDIGAMPDMTAEESQFLSAVVGLAVTAEEGRATEGINAFLSWLTEGKRLGSASLSCGLLPATAYESREDRLSQAMEGFASEYRLYTHGGVYSSLRESFDAQMREELARVY